MPFADHPAPTESVLAALEEAVLREEGVSEAIGALARAVDAEHATLVRFCPRRTTLAAVVTPELRPALDIYMAGNAPPDVRAIRLKVSPHSGFRLDQDDFTAEEMKFDPFYQEWLRPLGCSWNAGACLIDDERGMVTFSLKRRLSRGAFDETERQRLDAILPRLRRIARLGQAAAGARASGAAPAVLVELSHLGRVLRVPRGWEALAGAGLTVRNERLLAARPGQQGRLDAAVEAACRHQGIAGAVLLDHAGSEGTTLLRLMPLNHPAREVLAGVAAIATAQPLARRASADAELAGILAAFDFTGAETRVATLLACGWAPPAIAAQLGIKHETVRSHVKQILAKTGTGKQTEFVSLVWRLMR